MSSALPHEFAEYILLEVSNVAKKENPQIAADDNPFLKELQTLPSDGNIVVLTT